ncbi:MAG: hypothetical protein HQK53_03475 [Oligoflexia bacterium]|nr:hypothetical protein [Oligoflexia bacterium]
MKKSYLSSILLSSVLACIFCISSAFATENNFKAQNFDGDGNYVACFYTKVVKGDGFSNVMVKNECPTEVLITNFVVKVGWYIDPQDIGEHVIDFPIINDGKWVTIYTVRKRSDGKRWDFLYEMMWNPNNGSSSDFFCRHWANRPMTVVKICRGY